jgi:hypothetical protein
MGKGDSIVPLIKLNISREEQVILGNKMKELIIDKLERKFSVKYQGSSTGKIATMVIVGSSVSYIKEVKSYMWSHFRTGQDKINGHGSIDTTIVIQLSELDQISKTMIEVEYKKVFPNGSKNIHIENIVKKDVVIEKIVEVVNTPKVKPEKRRLSISLFLSSLLTFERNLINPASVGNIKLKDYFVFEKDLSDGYTVLKCGNEDYATKIEKALKWFIGDTEDNDSILKIDNQVFIKLSEIQKRKEKSSGVLFCLPPSCTASYKEVESRLRRVSKGSIPIMSYYGPINAFYTKDKTAERVYCLITEMGWFVKLYDNHNLTVFTTKPEAASLDSDVVSIETIDISSTEAEKLEEKIESAPILSKTIGHNFFPKFIEPVASKEDALIELEKLYLNQEIFSALSSDVQKEVTSVLKESWVENHVEDYVKDLLTFFKK